MSRALWPGEVSVLKSKPPKKIESDDAFELRRKTRATKVLNAVNIVIPAIGGIVIALAVLRVGRPFPDRSTYVGWLAASVLLSIITSTIFGVLLQRIMPITRLFDISTDFDTELKSRFRTVLRAGNLRSQLRSGQVEMSKIEQLEHVMRLLDRMNRHERLTRGHSERVRAYSTLIGEELELEEEELETLGWAALLHDVGKLDVPNSILTSPNAPTKAQWAVLKRHPSFADSYLQPLDSWLGDAAKDAAGYHHERWDGDGYPHGTAGEDTPLFGRIVAVADAFDVMTHARSYKKPLPIAEARDRLSDSSGTQFDPEVVEAFLAIGEPKLRAIRGWAATIAGVALSAESSAVTIASQVGVAATVITGGVAVAEPPPPSTVPPAIAFENEAPEPIAESTTTSAPSTTTEDPPATSTTTSTTSTTTTTIITTARPVEFINIGYEIQTIEHEGVPVTVSGDRLDVFVDGALQQRLTLEPDDRKVTVVIDVSDLAPGTHVVRFDLYDVDELVSTESIPIRK